MTILSISKEVILSKYSKFEIFKALEIITYKLYIITKYNLIAIGKHNCIF